MSAKRKRAQREPDEQSQLVETLYRLAEARFKADTFRIREPHPLTRAERFAFDDLVFVCRRLSDRAPLIERLRALSAHYARSILNEESPK